MPHQNPVGLDPTRTTVLRQRFVRQMNVRFARLARAVRELIVEEDAFGLKPRPNTPLTLAQRFAFLSDDAKVDAFNEWLQEQVDVGILETGTIPPWTSEFIDNAYRRGVTRAFIDTREGANLAGLEFFEGTKAEFLDAAFNSPTAVSKLRLLGTRTFEGLKGVTNTMSNQLNRIFADGISRGAGARELAKDITDQIGAINRTRARVLARTEIVHAHSEGQLDSFERLGVEEVGILAEFSTAGDDLVCPMCLPLEGTVFKIKEARGIIPRHPNCRCAWIPAFDDVREKGQVRGKSDIDARIRRSLRGERPGAKTVREARRLSRSRIADVSIDKNRPAPRTVQNRLKRNLRKARK